MIIFFVATRTKIPIRTMNNMPKPKISLIITDLDNTLFDWVDMWYKSFSAMKGKILEISGVSEDRLLKEVKQIFQKHKTSEYSMLVQELLCLKEKHPNQDLTQIYQEAIRVYRETRRAALCLYPSVMETLLALKKRGCVIIGYTESLAFYSNYRIRKLGLDGVIDILYSPPDHNLPENLTPEQIRQYPPGHYKFKFTKHKFTPKGKLKPNSEILESIIKDIGIPRARAIYIGDSLMKDIAMAQEAGVSDIWAKYGTVSHRPEYELLRKVTHWTQKQVEKEKQLSEKDIKPTYTLKKSFKELLNYFDPVRE